ncbi:hypothetical protein [Halomonas sp. E19]|uniref:hypothetical protein n=1 Tax=Halomonas sp. E19 TaxID=3397247 RepID=UPI004034262B
MLKRLLPVLILAIGVAGFVALRLTRPEPDEAVPQERSWRVEAMTVAYAEQVPVLPLFGEVVAPDRVSLVAPMVGRIAERPVREGQRVAAGTLLVALEEADVLPPCARPRPRWRISRRRSPTSGYATPMIVTPWRGSAISSPMPSASWSAPARWSSATWPPAPTWTTPAIPWPGRA